MVDGRREDLITQRAVVDLNNHPNRDSLSRSDAKICPFCPMQLSEINFGPQFANDMACCYYWATWLQLAQFKPSTRSQVIDRDKLARLEDNLNIDIISACRPTSQPRRTDKDQATARPIEAMLPPAQLKPHDQPREGLAGFDWF